MLWTRKIKKTHFHFIENTFKIFHLILITLICVSVWTVAHGCKYPWKTKENIGFPFCWNYRGLCLTEYDYWELNIVSAGAVQTLNQWTIIPVPHCIIYSYFELRNNKFINIVTHISYILTLYLFRSRIYVKILKIYPTEHFLIRISYGKHEMEERHRHTSFVNNISCPRPS